MSAVTPAHITRSRLVSLALMGKLSPQEMDLFGIEAPAPRQHSSVVERTAR